MGLKFLVSANQWTYIEKPECWPLHVHIQCQLDDRPEAEVSFLEMVIQHLHVQDIYDSWQPQKSKLQDFTSLNTGFVSLLRLSTSKPRGRLSCAHRRTVHWASPLPVTPQQHQPATASSSLSPAPTALLTRDITSALKIIRYFMAYSITPSAALLLWWTVLLILASHSIKSLVTSFI